ncbi:nickel ABC transporter permease [Lysinibacillus fusiformis]|jgi:peptide/nickel transport system permease protein|uniref:nickel ABC transporter permease n=1 Tax=Lysinibacillus TaxID=400634 RepID=UPI0001DA52AB|nr:MULTISPECIES: nickel ABC transporter permease [Lysinibacillus]EFI69973.1 ABC transporter permease protein [Lysinibacillus fusiformis ZC1]EKU44401.1 ABC transporter permease protein [Lysinibacillus fusiformis ZB2]QSB08765.1 ABC transporter permease [Lysinibacillus fusiformis]
MLSYILRRLSHTVLVIIAVSLIIFFAIRLTGDPVSIMFGAGEPSQQAVEELTAKLGLDRPVWEQYIIFMKDLVTLDFGTSYRSNSPVLEMLLERAWPTLALALGGMTVALLIAIPIGILSAVYKGKSIDIFGRIFSLLGISFPNFWLAFMLILIFAVQLKWLPVSGFEGFSSLILPSIALGLILSGILVRLIRTSMLEVLKMQYVTTARAKGIREWLVIIRHAFRNALLPTVTFVGLQFGGLLGGAVIVEQVFSWPGIGRLIVDSINQRDYPVVQGGVILLALIMIVVNLIVDLCYSLINPKIRTGRGDN